MRLWYLLFTVMAVGGFANCSFDTKPIVGAPGTGGITGTGTGGGFVLPGTGGRPVIPCTGLRCQQPTCFGAGCVVPACPSGMMTTVTGTVFDPAGKVPLYNAKVYVPNAPLAEIHEGPSCDACATSLSGEPVTQADSDVAGHFTLTDMPVGNNIPIVVQIGKWRRQTTIANVPACVTTALADPDQTRLPRNQSEGHIPKIALSTGAVDALECLLRKIGIEDSEFTPETGTGRINLYAGGMNAGNNTGDGTLGYSPALNGGAMFTRSVGWWDSVDNLNKYDMVLLSCEGVENSTNKSPAAVQAMQTFADAGGRVFASHWHNWWIEHGPAPWPTAATFNHRNDPPNPLTGTIDQTFPKGMALAQWLVNVGASTAPGGTLTINGAKRTLSAVMGPATQRWIYNTMQQTVQYFSFTTPYGTGSCGKVVFTDLHVTSGAGGVMNDASSPMLPFPTGCRTTDLSPQEKALEFVLFDLSACIIPTIP